LKTLTTKLEIFSVFVTRVLTIKDLSIEDETVIWEYGQTHVPIKAFEEFPYYLYKAIWDYDFKAIQWAKYENGETILINYSVIQNYLIKYFPERLQNTEAEYRVEHNRLRHNLVEVFGFNEICKQNLKTYRDEEHLREFFDELHTIDTPLDNWVEYHHPDFFQDDNSGHEIPKGKNSKFFKLCQTLKMPYRLRKPDGNVDVNSKKRRRTELVSGDIFGSPYGPMGGPWPPCDFARICPPLQIPNPLSKSLPDNLRDIPHNDLVGSENNLDQESIDRVLAESFDSNSVSRDNELLSVGSSATLENLA
jgi:hypothetical protein